MGHWANTAQADHVILRPWPLTLDAVASVADVSRRPSSIYQVWSSSALPFGRYGARCVSALIGLVTLTFEPLTLKLVCESHLRWWTFLPNLGTLGRLFSNYSLCSRRTDKRTESDVIASSVPTTTPWMFTRPVINFSLHFSDESNTPPKMFRHRFYELCDEFKN